MFLSEDMVNPVEGDHLFRKQVDETTGSISLSDFEQFFKSRWSAKTFEDLIAILLWLGLCYKGKEGNVFIPALIDKNGKPGDPWLSKSPYAAGEEEWVMGFSIEHQKNEITLAPMSLWHRFQVELAQTPKFNGEFPDNDFVAGKYFMTFTVEYMHVLIEVDAKEDIPTFDEISIFVKPKFSKEEVHHMERKQHQVNLADNLVNVLLELWDDICGGVQYSHKVVWPWPVSQSRPAYKNSRNVEVAQVKKRLQMHGMGRKMQWTVGHDSAITEDQLLSTRDKTHGIQSAQNDVNALRQGMQEAVDLKIYPLELIEESAGPPLDGSTAAIQLSTVVAKEALVEEETKGLDVIERATSPANPTATNLQRLSIASWQKVDKKLDMIINNQFKIFKKVENVECMLQEGFAQVLNEQKKVLRKLQDTERFFKEDRDRICPNLIYLVETESGIWGTLKQALSPTVNVRLRFGCEAMYNNYRPHEVKHQQGLDVSALKPALKKIAPWLKVSLTILLTSAKIGANFLAPGAGLILPNFQQWQPGSSLLEGIVWATGFPKDELDKLIMEEMGVDANAALWNPRDVYGKSRAAIAELIGKLTPDSYEENFGLRKVCLARSDGFLHGVVWICTDCLKNFRNSNLVSEVS
ncbi:unnamed protein product [Calypogeia fissa]